MQVDQGGTTNDLSQGGQGPSPVGNAISGMLRGTASSLGDTVRTLVRSEVKLAKTELKQEATQVGMAGGMIAGGGVLGLTGFVFLMFGLIHLLGRKLPMWVSASLVGTVLIAVAGMLGATGKTRLQDASLKPDQTIESLHEVRDSVQEAAQH